MAKSKALPETTPVEAPKSFDRMTMVLNVHHEHAGDQPHSIQIIFDELLSVKEECYSRRYKVGKEWETPRFGHFADSPQDIGTIIVQNLEGQGLTVHPTEEEKKDIASRVVLVSYVEDVGAAEYIKPGEGRPFRPVNPSRMRICCLSSDGASIRLTVIPK